jgi:hypothetical protein
MFDIIYYVTVKIITSFSIWMGFWIIYFVMVTLINNSSYIPSSLESKFSTVIPPNDDLLNNIKWVNFFTLDTLNLIGSINQKTFDNIAMTFLIFISMCLNLDILVFWLIFMYQSFYSLFFYFTINGYNKNINKNIKLLKELQYSKVYDYILTSIYYSLVTDDSFSGIIYFIYSRYINLFSIFIYILLHDDILSSLIYVAAQSILQNDRFIKK